MQNDKEKTMNMYKYLINLHISHTSSLSRKRAGTDQAKAKQNVLFPRKKEPFLWICVEVTILKWPLSQKLHAVGKNTFRKSYSIHIH